MTTLFVEHIRGGDEGPKKGITCIDLQVTTKATVKCCDRGLEVFYGYGFVS
jgi:hypothetical protein